MAGNQLSPAQVLDNILTGADRRLMFGADPINPAQVVRQYASESDRQMEFVMEFKAVLSTAAHSIWMPATTTYYESYIFLDLIAKYPGLGMEDSVLEMLQLFQGGIGRELQCPSGLPSYPSLDRLAVDALSCLHRVCNVPHLQVYRGYLSAVAASAAFQESTRGFALAQWMVDSPGHYRFLPEIPDIDSESVSIAFKKELWQNYGLVQFLGQLQPERYAKLSIHEILRLIGDQTEDLAALVLEGGSR